MIPGLVLGAAPAAGIAPGLRHSKIYGRNENHDEKGLVYK